MTFLFFAGDAGWVALVFSVGYAVAALLRWCETSSERAKTPHKHRATAKYVGEVLGGYIVVLLVTTALFALGYDALRDALHPDAPTEPGRTVTELHPVPGTDGRYVVPQDGGNFLVAVKEDGRIRGLEVSALVARDGDAELVTTVTCETISEPFVWSLTKECTQSNEALIPDAS